MLHGLVGVGLPHSMRTISPLLSISGLQDPSSHKGHRISATAVRMHLQPHALFKLPQLFSPLRFGYFLLSLSFTSEFLTQTPSSPSLLVNTHPQLSLPGGTQPWSLQFSWRHHTAWALPLHPHARLHTWCPGHARHVPCSLKV